MINWNFNSSNYDPNKSFELIPVGDHRVRIESATEETSKSGKQMIKLTLAVSGYGSSLWHYIVFMPDRPEITDQNLGFLWDSFSIQPGDLNILGWEGKVGAARVKHEMYDGKPQAKVSNFILKSKQDKLPPWKENKNGGAAPASAPASFRSSFPATGTDDEADIPF